MTDEMIRMLDEVIKRMPALRELGMTSLRCGGLELHVSELSPPPEVPFELEHDLPRGERAALELMGGGHG